MARGTIWALLPLGFTLCASSQAAQGPLTIQDPASAQPTLPKPMPELSIPGSGSSDAKSKKPHAQIVAHHGGSRHHVRSRSNTEPLDRPELANVELTEPLPHPPQPPHVLVPVPGYAFDNLVTYYTAPPPPVVCRLTRYDRFAPPDRRLVDQTPVLCTADNP